jgi:histidinol-phosphate phosphatase family protein
VTYDVVIPTAGRAALGALLPALAAGDGPLPEGVLLVDDRVDRSAPLVGGRHLGPLVGRVFVLPGPARGPAAARNVGWRAARAPWVAFLDDDVIPPPGWRAALAADLDGLGERVAGSQGRIRVPLPRHRRPTDWERNVGGLERARWATADLAYRRDALAAVGGFDERFPRAYREDADLGLRLVAAGWEISAGRRRVLHPVGEAGPAVSLVKQAGNADDVLMRALHGRAWRARAGVPAGRRPRHLATALAGIAGIGLAVAGRRRAAALAAAGWGLGTAELAWARIAPGPRTPAETATMLWTSVAMPFVAGAWWLRGVAGLRRALRDERRAPRPRPRAVLFDRDGTLVADVPYNGDPDRVALVPGAREALDRLRVAGIATGVVSNQSGVARGRITPAEVEAVNARLAERAGPLGAVEWCPHGPDDGCGCRKPAPGLVLRAAARLGVAPGECAVVGDIGADVEAARAAGARGVLVPTPVTRPEEIAVADEVVPDLAAAVDLLLDGRPAGVPGPVPLAPPRRPGAAAPALEAAA